MMRLITSIDDLVGVFGGQTKLADRLGIVQPNIANWKSQGLIPPGWHYELQMMALERGMEIAPEVFGLPTGTPRITELVVGGPPSSDPLPDPPLEAQGVMA